MDGRRAARVRITPNGDDADAERTTADDRDADEQQA
jgi:hypothetical protein